MTRLIWGEPSSRVYEAGVDQGVLYPGNGPGVAWNGLVRVSETTKKVAGSINYLDGLRYYNRTTSDSFSGTLEALTYPDEFLPFDGSAPVTSQRRPTFGLSYRSRRSDAADSNGYKLHLIYNATARPTEKAYSTIAQVTEPEPFAWTLDTRPIKLPGLRPTAHVVIDSTVTHAWTMAAIEDLLYGSGTQDPRLPSPEEMIQLFESGTILRIIDHGDGTWTATGPDEAIQMLDATTFQISWPTVIYIDDVTFQISSR